MERVTSAATHIAGRICLALILVIFSDWMLNASLHPATAQIAPIAREVSSLVKTATFLVAAVVSYINPRLLRPRAISLAAAVFILIALVLETMGLAASSAPAMVMGSFFMASSRGWATVLVGMALISLEARDRVKTVVVAFVVGYSFLWVVNPIPALVAIPLLSAISVACIAACLKPASPFFAADRDADCEPAVLSVVQPSSVVSLASTAFISIFLFCVAYGYSLTFQSIDGSPLVYAFAGVFLLVVLAAFMSSERFTFDALYRVSALVVIGGFLASLTVFAPAGFSNSLLILGSGCFHALVWCLLPAMAHRNIYLASAIVPWGFFVLQAGIFCGTTLGHFANGLYTSNPDLLVLVTCMVVFIFASYQILVLPGFSFDGTIYNIQSVEEGTVRVRIDELRDRCGILAAERGLTKRESEIFELLAKGRNNRFIQEELCLTHNTVKTHIMHIYAKLSVHSHQELIDLVESRI